MKRGALVVGLAVIMVISPPILSSFTSTWIRSESLSSFSLLLLGQSQNNSDAKIFFLIGFFSFVCRAQPFLFCKIDFWTRKKQSRNNGSFLFFVSPRPFKTKIKTTKELETHFHKKCPWNSIKMSKMVLRVEKSMSTNWVDFYFGITSCFDRKRKRKREKSSFVTVLERKEHV